MKPSPPLSIDARLPSNKTKKKANEIRGQRETNWNRSVRYFLNGWTNNQQDLIPNSFFLPLLFLSFLFSYISSSFWVSTKLCWEQFQITSTYVTFSFFLVCFFLALDSISSFRFFYVCNEWP